MWRRMRSVALPEPNTISSWARTRRSSPLSSMRVLFSANWIRWPSSSMTLPSKRPLPTTWRRCVGLALPVLIPTLPLPRITVMWVAKESVRTVPVASPHPLVISKRLRLPL